MQLLLINCLISIFASSCYKQVIIKNNERSDISGEKSKKLDTRIDNARTFWN